MTVPIHGKTVDQSAVVEALIPHALLPNVPLSRIFHLDISPSVGAQKHDLAVVLHKRNRRAVEV